MTPTEGKTLEVNSSGPALSLRSITRTREGHRLIQTMKDHSYWKGGGGVANAIFTFHYTYPPDGRTTDLCDEHDTRPDILHTQHNHLSSTSTQDRLHYTQHEDGESIHLQEPKKLQYRGITTSFNVCQ